MQRRTLDTSAPKGVLKIWMAAATAALVAVPVLAAPPALDSSAPDFVLKAIDGRNLRLSEFRGEPVIVHFWASWCGPCRESAARVDELGAQSATPVLGVSLDDTTERASAVAQSLRLQSPTLVDTGQAVARTYDVAKLPLTLLLDSEGTIRAAWSGVAPNPAELTPQLNRLRQD